MLTKCLKQLFAAANFSEELPPSSLSNSNDAGYRGLTKTRRADGPTGRTTGETEWRATG